MADYRLTETDAVIRVVDEAWIPNSPDNIDRQAYDRWLADGGVPDPYVPPTPPSPIEDPVQDVILYDHENRLRAIEGQSPLSIADFKRKFGLK
jgi:hypothetical protein